MPLERLPGRDEDLVLEEGRTSNGTGFRAGILGAGVMSGVLAAARASGITEINLELMLGSLITRDADPGTWVLGFALHLLLGGFIGMAYAAGFRAIARSGWMIGAIFSVIHWFISGVALGMLGALHPAPRRFAHPGYFGTDLGARSFFVLLAAHLAYGILVGWIYRRAKPEVVIDVDVKEQRAA